MKNLAKQTAHLISRNILSTAAVLTLMGAAAFAAAPVGGYQPGETLNPDCSPTDVDCKVVFTQAPNKFIDGTTATDAVFTGGDVGIGTDSPRGILDVSNSGLNFIMNDTGVQNDTYNLGFGSGSADRLTFLTDQGLYQQALQFGDAGPILSNDTTVFGLSTMSAGETIFTPKFVVQQDGDFGINTIAPDAKLEVATDGVSGDAFKITDGTNTDMVVTQDGNVGIGTDIINSSFDLNIRGNALMLSKDNENALMNQVTYSNNVVGSGIQGVKGRGTFETKLSAQKDDNLFYINGYTSYGTGVGESANIIYVSDGIPSSSSTPGKIIFKTTPTGTKNSAERMVIKSDGNVGIGTTTPSAKLEVKGTITSRLGSTGSPMSLQTILDPDASFSRGFMGHNAIWNYESNEWETISVGANDAQGILMPNNGGLNFVVHSSTSSTARTFSHADFVDGTKMKITNAGNVGIGTTTPSEKLEVDGKIKLQTIGGPSTGLSLFNYGGDGGSNTGDTYCSQIHAQAICLAAWDDGIKTDCSTVVSTSSLETKFLCVQP